MAFSDSQLQETKPETIIICRIVAFAEREKRQACLPYLSLPLRKLSRDSLGALQDFFLDCICQQVVCMQCLCQVSHAAQQRELYYSNASIRTYMQGLTGRGRKNNPAISSRVDK